MTPSTPGADGSPKAPKGKTKDVIPFGELELATLGLAAADAWETSPLAALLWCEKARLRTLAKAFKASIETADVADDELSPAAARLTELDQLIDTSLKFVRNYLIEAHGSKKAAKAHYDAFGLTAAGLLRTARPARVEDLTKLVKALKASDYDKSKYGTAYWQALLTEYAPLVATSSAARQGSATETGTKYTQEKPLHQILRALRQHIKTNFPDTYKAELRGFGYLKEGY